MAKDVSISGDPYKRDLQNSHKYSKSPDTLRKRALEQMEQHLFNTQTSSTPKHLQHPNFFNAQTRRRPNPHSWKSP